MMLTTQTLVHCILIIVNVKVWLNGKIAEGDPIKTGNFNFIHREAKV